jgi:hypothetical protein
VRNRAALKNLYIDRVFLLVAAVIVRAGRHGGEGDVSPLTHKRLFESLVQQLTCYREDSAVKRLLPVSECLQRYRGFR